MPSDFQTDFPPFTLVTASSEALLSGCESPAEAAFGPALLSQWIPVGRNEINTISVLLTGRASGPAPIPARIFACAPPTDPADQPTAARLLHEGTLTWKKSGDQWIEWEVKLSPLSGMKVGHYVRVELDLPENIGWRRNRSFDPACPGGIAPAGAAPSHLQDVTFCFRVFPAQPCFWPANILPATPGSHRFTGAWKSDPAAGLPQWIDVSWKDPFSLEELAIDFPDSSECPVDYRIEVSAQNAEPHMVEVAQNHSCHSVHPFDPPIHADRVRVVFLSSRGGSSVSINRIQSRRSQWQRSL